jgi:transposase
MRKLYHVTLTDEELTVINDIISKGRHSAEKRKRAQALLHAHQGWNDEKTADAANLSVRAVELLRKRFIEEGFESTLHGKPRGHRQPALDGDAEAHLVALTCSPKPEGRSRWTIRLLRDKIVVDLELDSLSHETVRQTLKKTNSSLGKK